MKIPHSVLFAAILLSTACERAPARATSAPQAAQSTKAPAPVIDDQDKARNPSKRRLSASVRLDPEGREYFGVVLSSLSNEQRAIVRSAWDDYRLVLAGGKPDCEVAYGLSDGGTYGYFCDGYDIVRVRTLEERGGAIGYEYGAIVDFLEGRKIESLRFYTQEELQGREARARQK